MKKRIFIILILIGSTFLFKAQNWQWAKNVAGNGEGMALTTDALGNVFAFGYFSGPISVGNYTLSQIGIYNAYLIKYDSNGNVIWAKNTNCDGNVFGYSISSDALGNIYCAGYYSGLPFVLGTYTLTNSGGLNVILIKYDSNGNVIWVKTSTGNCLFSTDCISTDLAGNSYVSGTFSSPNIVFGTYTLTNTGSESPFIVKYDYNGNVLWAQSSIGVGSNIAKSVCVDANGDAIVTGFFSSPLIVFNTFSLTNSGGNDIFIVKYSSGGNVLWAKSAIGISDDRASSVSVDNNNNSYVTGSYMSSTLVFGTQSLTGLGGIFTAKYDLNGNVLWVKSSVGGNGVYSASAYNEGVFIMGSVGLGGAPMSFDSYTIDPQIGFLDPCFLAQYDLNGNVLYAESFGSGGDDQNAVCVDKYCNAYIIGDFNINPFIIGTNSLTQIGGGENIFTAKLSFTSINCQMPPTSNKEFLSKINGFIFYPNPNNGSFKLQIDNEIKNGELIVVNSLGEKVHEQKITQGTNDINIKLMAVGLYHCKILQNKQRVGQVKISIE